MKGRLVGQHPSIPNISGRQLSAQGARFLNAEVAPIFRPRRMNRRESAFNSLIGPEQWEFSSEVPIKPTNP